MDFDNICLGCMEETNGKGTCPKCGWIAGSEPESPLHLKPGTILNGKYLLGRVLGHGGFGITYLAVDLNLGAKLAIKEYFPSGMATRNIGDTTISIYSGSTKEHFKYGLDKFIDEARTLSKFDDVPEIISIKDFFKENGTAYLVMSYIDGITLKEYLEQRGGVLPLDAAMTIMFPVMKALDKVHAAGILHRDISPDNIYITKEFNVKLLDFGAARFAIGEQNKSLSILLKPGYAPEEQYRSRGNQGPWTDIYSTAATFYKLITGQTPVEALERLEEDNLAAPSSLGVDILPGTEAVLMNALSVRAQGRYQSMKEFQEAFAQSIASPRKGPEPVIYGGGTIADEGQSSAFEPFVKQEEKIQDMDLNHGITSTEVQQDKGLNQPVNLQDKGIESISERKAKSFKTIWIGVAAILGSIILIAAITQLFVGRQAIDKKSYAPVPTATSTTAAEQVVSVSKSTTAVDVKSEVTPAPTATAEPTATAVQVEQTPVPAKLELAITVKPEPTPVLTPIPAPRTPIPTAPPTASPVNKEALDKATALLDSASANLAAGNSRLAIDKIKQAIDIAKLATAAGDNSIEMKKLLLYSYNQISFLSILAGNAKQETAANVMAGINIGVELIKRDSANIGLYQPMLAYLYSYQCLCNLVSGDNNGAVQAANNAVRTATDLYGRDSSQKDILVDAYDSLSFAQIYSGDYAGAIDSCTKGLGINSNKPVFQMNLAIAYLLKGQYSSAKDICAKYKDIKLKGSFVTNPSTMKLYTDPLFSDLMVQSLKDLKSKGISGPDTDKMIRYLTGQGE